MSIKSKLDQFYTSSSVVDEFLEIINNFGFINKETIFIEPSAGDGKFIDGLNKKFPDNNFFAYDIQKNHPDVMEQDFLTTKISHSMSNLVIGNPPFGIRAKLAIDFVNHSSKFSNIICFIVPIQFRRWNVQKKINKGLKLIYSGDDLSRNPFLLNNKPYHVNCCFQIWVNKHDNRFNNIKDLRILNPPINKHEDFKLFIYNNTLETRKYFNKDKYEWDFAVHRQGYYDYNIKVTNESDLKTNRQYLFIKYINPVSKDIISQIDFEKLSNTNTTVKGFSNTDFVAEYLKIKKKLKL